MNPGKKPSKKILSLKGLSDLCGMSVCRLAALHKEGRLQADYVDQGNTPYWSLERGKDIADTIKASKAVYRPGSRTPLRIMPE